MNGKTNSGPRAEIERRLRKIEQAIDGQLPPHPPAERTPERGHQHLLEEAQELYRNELAWEEETGEESMDSGFVVALVFPGTLALIDALVTSHPATEQGEGGPHRDVVLSFLDWLADRLFRLRAGEGGVSGMDRAKQVDLTDRLIDLVIYRYCSLDASEVERLEELES